MQEIDKNILEQYRALHSEIRLLDEQIREVESEIKETHITDTVKGSMPEFPYIYHNISLYGAENTEEVQAIMRELFSVKVRRQRAYHESVRMLNKLENYITTIEDSLVRQILTLRYIKGCTWLQVALKIGGYNTPDSVRMIHNRYLEKAEM